MSLLQLASTFSGVGGIDLGFAAAGIPTRLLCEYDKHAAAVLARQFPGVTIHPDVQELTADDLYAAGLEPGRTVLAGGFPCQDLSVAGARRGMGEGTRSGLYWHLDRLMGEFRPAWVVFENVPGLLSSNGGRDMGAILGSLADRGYGFAYRVLDAQFFGVPQRRRRVVIVGRLGDTGATPAQVLLEPEGGGWDSATSDTAGTGTATGAARGARRTGRQVAPALTAREGKGPDSDATTTLIVNSLTAANGGPDDNMAQAGHLVAHTFQKVVRPAPSEHPDVWAHRDVSATLSPFDLGSEARAVELVVQPFAEGHDASEDGTGRGTPIIGFHFGSHPGAEYDMATTLTTRNGDGGAVATETTVRRLTPLECERLQGHPDNWTEGQADSHRYKQMGNGVAVPVFEWVARRLAATHASKEVAA